MDPTNVQAGLETPARYLDWGWLSISLPNLIVILLMLLIFVLAVLLPFPKDKDEK
jgi:hypothetical protein